MIHALRGVLTKRLRCEWQRFGSTCQINQDPDSRSTVHSQARRKVLPADLLDCGNFSRDCCNEHSMLLSSAVLQDSSFLPSSLKERSGGITSHSITMHHGGGPNNDRRIFLSHNSLLPFVEHERTSSELVDAGLQNICQISGTLNH